MKEDPPYYHKWISYRPSNGTEGMMFMEYWCSKCTFQHPEYLGCNEIIGNSMVYEKNDPEYPKELLCRFDNQGMRMKCTKFRRLP